MIGAYAKQLKLLNNDFVVDFVECLGKVKVYHIMFMTIKDALDDSVNIFEELGPTAAPLSKPMLVFREELI